MPKGKRRAVRQLVERNNLLRCRLKSRLELFVWCSIGWIGEERVKFHAAPRPTLGRSPCHEWSGNTPCLTGQPHFRRNDTLWVLVCYRVSEIFSADLLLAKHVPYHPAKRGLAARMARKPLIGCRFIVRWRRPHDIQTRPELYCAYQAVGRSAHFRQHTHFLDPKQRLAIVRDTEPIRFREANKVKLLLHTHPP